MVKLKIILASHWEKSSNSILSWIFYH